MKLLFPLIALLLLTACPNNQGQDTKSQSDNNQVKQQNTAPLIEVTPQDNQETHQKPIEPKKPKETIADEIFNNGFAIDDYPIVIEKISKQEYQSAFDKLTQKENPKTTIIEDLEKAKTLLQGIVEFEENTEVDGIIKSIHFKNGGSIYQPEAFFIAYYPDDNILLAEGEHSSDMSFNLNTGKQIERVGNPHHNDLPSPSGNYRMTSYYGGQECHTYFIQKRVNGEWIKIIEINEIFNRALKSEHQHFLCFLRETFFANDNTLYAIEYKDHPKEVLDYYKITLKSDKSYRQMDFTNIPNISLPLEVAIDFDNYEKLIQLNKQQAKFFAGLYPTAKEMVVLGKVSYQPDITSLIMTFTNTENEHDLKTHLINIDKNGNVIDTLEIAYDEIAESWSKTTALLDKEQIKVTDFHDGDPTQENSYKIDDKGYFYLVDSKDFTNQENSNDN